MSQKHLDIAAERKAPLHRHHSKHIKWVLPLTICGTMGAVPLAYGITVLANPRPADELAFTAKLREFETQFAIDMHNSFKLVSKNQNITDAAEAEISRAEKAISDAETLIETAEAENDAITDFSVTGVLDHFYQNVELITQKQDEIKHEREIIADQEKIISQNVGYLFDVKPLVAKYSNLFEEDSFKIKITPKFSGKSLPTYTINADGSSTSDSPFFGHNINDNFVDIFTKDIPNLIKKSEAASIGDAPDLQDSNMEIDLTDNSEISQIVNEHLSAPVFNARRSSIYQPDPSSLFGTSTLSGLGSFGPNHEWVKKQTFTGGIAQGQKGFINEDTPAPSAWVPGNGFWTYSEFVSRVKSEANQNTPAGLYSAFYGKAQPANPIFDVTENLTRAGHVLARYDDQVNQIFNLSYHLIWNEATQSVSIYDTSAELRRTYDNVFFHPDHVRYPDRGGGSPAHRAWSEDFRYSMESTSDDSLRYGVKDEVLIAENVSLFDAYIKYLNKIIDIYTPSNSHAKTEGSSAEAGTLFENQPYSADEIYYYALLQKDIFIKKQEVYAFYKDLFDKVFLEDSPMKTNIALYQSLSDALFKQIDMTDPSKEDFDPSIEFHSILESYEGITGIDTSTGTIRDVVKFKQFLSGFDNVFNFQFLSENELKNLKIGEVPFFMGVTANSSFVLEYQIKNSPEGQYIIPPSLTGDHRKPSFILEDDQRIHVNSSTNNLNKWELSEEDINDSIENGGL